MLWTGGTAVPDGSCQWTGYMSEVGMPKPEPNLGRGSLVGGIGLVVSGVVLGVRLVVGGV